MTVSVWPSLIMTIISSCSKLSSGTAPSGALFPVRNAKVRPPPTLFIGTASMMPLPGMSMKSRRLALFMSWRVMSPQATEATSALLRGLEPVEAQVLRGCRAVAEHGEHYGQAVTAVDLQHVLRPGAVHDGDHKVHYHDATSQSSMMSVSASCVASKVSLVFLERTT